MADKQKLIGCLEQYDKSRRALLEELSALPTTTLTAIYSPGRWSILQVVQHMIRAEYAVLRNLPDPSRLVHRKPGIRGHLGYLTVVFVLLFNIPVPVPGPEMMPHDDVPHLEDLMHEWGRNIGWLKKFFNNLTESTEWKAVFYHPVTGPLTPSRAIRIAQLHLDTHRRHIARIQRRLAQAKHVS